MRQISRLGLSFVVLMLFAESAARAQQDPNFGRVSNIRRQVVAKQPRGGQQPGLGQSQTSDRAAIQADPLRPYTQRPPGFSSSSRAYSSGSRLRVRPAQPTQVTIRDTPHTYYPGMRSGQSLNRSVPRRDALSKYHPSPAGMTIGGSMGLLPSLGQAPR